ncbi:MAG: 4-hydroxy-tetrahydrodipicolinate synthase [Paludibacteraceae bacterium]|nr:4-hydroxy-tetrahydrodipicolinate synthase [Paludibacteraceae bacterium]
MEQLRGLGTALITPFKPDGEIDFASLERLLDEQIAHHVNYLVVLGTTGEAATMTDEEKRSVGQFIIDRVAGRLPLVLGCGGNCTAQVVHTLHEQREWIQAHFAAVLSVCPYYNKPNQEGLYRHFVAIAEASPVPVILYNVPGRTGVNMLPETVIRIWQTMPDKVIGIKEASGNLEQIHHLLGLVGSLPTVDRRSNGILPTASRRRTDGESTDEAPLMVISGDDGIAVEVMQAGGSGLISVASNAFPCEFGQIVRQQDESLQARYAELVHLLFREGNPTGIKAVLSQKGLVSNTLRLPLVPASDQLEADLHAELAKLT